MKPARASEREMDVLHVLWNLGGEASVADVLQAMNEGGSQLAYTTVQTLLNRLATKGQAERVKSGRLVLYRAAVERPSAARSALQALAARFFQGSVADIAAHLVQEELSEEDVGRVERLLERRKQQR